MPFDGKPEAFETKPDAFSIEGLIAWLETQNPSAEYNYADTGNCLYCQYLRSRGVDVAHLGGFTYVDSKGKIHSLGIFADLVIEAETPWTFGAALVRAKALGE